MINNFNPIETRLLVQTDEPISEIGIFLNLSNKANSGKIISVGNKVQNLALKRGTIVAFSKYVGHKLLKEEKLLILEEKDILGYFS